MPTTSPLRIAALDLGSNSFHLLIADASPAGELVPVLREKEMLRLGDVVARKGRLTDEAFAAALATVRRFAALARISGCDEVVACATSALRDAENTADFVAAVAAETTIDVEVISGAQEARLVFAAVRRSVVLQPAPALCLDLGGGSLEATIGDSDGAAWSTSVPLGVARLTAACVRKDPPSRGDLRRLLARIDEVFAPAYTAIAEHKPRLLVGTSGTLTDLAVAALARRSGTVPTSVNQLEVRRDELATLHDTLVRADNDQRQRVTGLEVRRAPVVVAGSVLLLRVMERCGFDRLTVGEWALREGMVLDALERRRGDQTPSDPRAIRRASVLELCRRYDWPAEHSRHVAGLALTLFDGTAALHGLDEGARELLEFGAFLHDVGSHVASDDPGPHSAYLIEHGRLRGFDPHEVAALAALGRYHRKGTPKPEFEPFARLDKRRGAQVRALAALLQVAHGLDHAATGAVTDLTVELTPEVVRLKVVATRDGQLELWGAVRVRERARKALGRPLELILCSPEPVPSPSTPSA